MKELQLYVSELMPVQARAADLVVRAFAEFLRGHPDILAGKADIGFESDLVDPECECVCATCARAERIQ